MREESRAAGLPLGQERRKSLRYASDRGVQCWRMPGMVPIWGKLRDVSLEGCFVETVVPFPVSSQVRLVLMLFGRRVRAEGEVRSSDPRRGMGIRFQPLKGEELVKMESALAHMGKPGKRLVNTSEELVKSIESWFETHDTMPREAFLHIRSSAALAETVDDEPGSEARRGN